MAPEKQREIRQRTFDFAITVVRLAENLPNARGAAVIAKQLVRSGTSIGANVEEAAAASSKTDFAYRMNIALREARETNYWLRIVSTFRWIASSDLNPVLQESEEIMKVLGAIVSSARGKRKV